MRYVKIPSKGVFIHRQKIKDKLVTTKVKCLLVKRLENNHKSYVIELLEPVGKMKKGDLTLVRPKNIIRTAMNIFTNMCYQKNRVVDTEFCRNCEYSRCAEKYFLD